MKRALLLLAVLLAAPGSTAAQSLFSARGLGLPVEPVDARARGLGGIGVGLVGFNPSLVNPAELGGPRRGVSAVLQPSSYGVNIGAAEGDVSASRFPMLAILYPLTPTLSLGFGYAGYLEQSWAVRTSGSVILDDVEIPVEDVVSSTGGIGQIRLSAAYALLPSLALGASGGVITGSLDRTASRVFNDTTLTLREFTTRLRWEYHGWFGGVGARWDPVPGVRLGASAMLTTEVDADSTGGAASGRTYDGALQLAAGASGRVTGDLVVALGAVRNRYPGLPEGSPDVDRETWTYGAGLEYEGLRAGPRTFPFRLGARVQELPYYGTDETAAREVAAMLGLGIRLEGDAGGPAAVVDLGIERASRSGLEGSALADGLDESVWRLTFSLALFGR
jgi:hypothetical protein